MHSDCEDGRNPNAHQSAVEEDCKEVQCVEVHALSKGRSDEPNPPNAEIESLLPLNDEDRPKRVAPGSSTNDDDDDSENFTKLDKPCMDPLSLLSPVKNVMNIKALAVTRSRSCKASLMSNSICSFLEDVEQDNEEFSAWHEEEVHSGFYELPKQGEESKANLQEGMLKTASEMKGMKEEDQVV